MGLSFVPYIDQLALGAKLIFPIYNSCNAIKSKDEEALMQWLAYWVIYAAFTFLDTYLLSFVAEYIPAYMELQALVFLWLVHPKSRGALWLWSELEALYAPVDRMIEEAKEKFLGVRGLPKGVSAAKVGGGGAKKKVEETEELLVEDDSGEDDGKKE